MNKKICFIGGTSLLGSSIFKGFKKSEIKNKFGKVTIFRKGNLFFIQRHFGNVPPHKINYKAYIKGLEDFKVRQIISICSAGCFKKDLKLPALFLPHDFIGFWNIPTFFDNEIYHSSSKLSNKLRKLILKIAQKNKIPIYPSGIYFQANGPRIETAAEIKFISKFSDVVGMTFSSEATLACEKNMEIASICTIDNYANGIAGEIDYKEVIAGAKKNQKKLEKLLKAIIKKFS